MPSKVCPAFHGFLVVSQAQMDMSCPRRVRVCAHILALLINIAGSQQPQLDQGFYTLKQAMGNCKERLTMCPSEWCPHVTQLILDPARQ